MAYPLLFSDLRLIVSPPEAAVKGRAQSFDFPPGGMIETEWRNTALITNRFRGRDEAARRTGRSEPANRVDTLSATAHNAKHPAQAEDLLAGPTAVCAA
jgi:hypothetical protein